MERKKRQRKPAVEADTSNLPCEVIYTILSKLPAKSLMRFRCVCKPWRAIISEPQFIKSHLSEAIKSDRQNLIYSEYRSECFYTIDYETCGESGEDVLYFPIKKYRKASVLCSCNGVVLLGLDNNKMYVLWNPSTREYKRFSCPISTCYARTTKYGLCYDSTVDDYKVVLILRDGLSHKSFMVFTCKTYSWTDIRDFAYLLCVDEVNANGVAHWVVTLKEGHNSGSLWQMPRRDGQNRNHNDCGEAMPSYRCISYFTSAVVYFDLVEDKFKEVPPPYWICEGVEFGVAVMKGYLSIYLYTHDFEQFDVWVMKEYGEKNSWTKFFTIPRYVGYSKPMFYTKTGEVVLMDIEKIFLYDPKENKLKNITPSTGLKYPSMMAVSYVDSLVLPTGDKLTKRQQHKHRENGEIKEL